MLKRALDYFSSVRLTIFLLILISAASLAGTVIVQNKTSSEYLEIYGPTLFSLIKITGAFDLYHSWYFKLMLALLSLNLIVCTLDRLPKIWRRIQKEQNQFPAHLPEKSPFHQRLEVVATGPEASAAVAQALKAGFSKVQTQESGPDRIFFTARGSLSLLGPYLTHLGILVIILGALIGSSFGFKGWLPLREGETADQALDQARGLSIPLPFSIRCDRFTIETYPDTNQPKHYKSLLTILQDGKEVLQKEIEVNHPLGFQGINFYQASYGQDPVVRLVAVKPADGTTIGGEVAIGQELVIAGDGISFAPVEYWPSLSGMGMDMGPTLAVEKRQGDQTLQEFKIFRNYPNFDRERKDKFFLQFKSVAEKKWTGLQVVKDPGVPVIWAGCGLLMIGIYFSFFIYHRRVWVRLRPASGDRLVVEIFGQTRKTEGLFEKQIQGLGQSLAQMLKKD